MEFDLKTAEALIDRKDAKIGTLTNALRAVTEALQCALDVDDGDRED